MAHHVEYSPLHLQLIDSSCSINKVKLLLEHINKKDRHGSSPLHVAVSNPDCTLDVVKLLLQNGLDVNKENNYGDSPLHNMFKRKDCSSVLIQLLLRYGGDLNKGNANGTSPFHYALINSGYDLDILEFLLNSGASITLCNNDGDSPLHFAVMSSKCKPTFVKTLINHGANILVTNQCGISPLQSAANNSNCGYDVIKVLIDNGSTVTTGYGESPLHCAVSRDVCSLKVTKLLLDSGASITAKNTSDCSILNCAVKSSGCVLALVKMLLNFKADINAVDCQKMSSLHSAVKNSNCGLDIIKYLLDNGAYINVGNKDGESALFFAVKYSREVEIMELLLHHGASLHTLTCWRSTPLIEAQSYYCSRNTKTNLECLKLLIKYAMLETLDFSLEDFVSRCNDEEISIFFSECFGEVQELLSENLTYNMDFVHFNVTLLKFIGEQRELGFKMAKAECEKREETICDQLLRILINKKFPLYGSIIAAAINRSAMLKQFHKQIIYAVNSNSNQGGVGKSVVLNYLSKCSLADYLTSESLLSLVLAFYDVSKSSDQTCSTKQNNQKSKRHKKNPPRKVKRSKLYI